MEHFLYDKDVQCPLCRNKFKTKKVRTRFLKVVKRDDDFCVTYKDINPIYYHIFTCPECGYSSSESEFNNLSKIGKEILEKSIRGKWSKRDFGGIRGHREAEEVYKLAILNGQLMKKPKGYIGGLCLKLAWIYREQNDKREFAFLKYALDLLEDAYQNERFPIASLDEVNLAYLIGELSRRLGDPKKSVVWYSKALDNPDIRRHRLLQIRAREQWSLAREQYKSHKEMKQNA
ncbi:DUF2225 domain-containing protein [Serpentinicella alkaliphila]|uniref:DUF2225 domain-containing protein n=1 Tax=Serpentinicella alkaliphila TaxID=1734049 RepID=A0A4R2U3C0_9FIRM|nr:DUF2225 domain-containing protein [Serpentinicella alkaliphila]QUH25980.1 DUF2225 domain-containing protein [Serpentinicella alkaliphila]TCQ02163.1 hypothetical protein EDD79_101843 [Serpentinicella alkaliphila]